MHTSRIKYIKKVNCWNYNKTTYAFYFEKNVLIKFQWENMNEADLL
jgi:hypothetical protein